MDDHWKLASSSVAQYVKLLSAELLTRWPTRSAILCDPPSKLCRTYAGLTDTASLELPWLPSKRCVSHLGHAMGDCPHNESDRGSRAIVHPDILKYAPYRVGSWNLDFSQNLSGLNTSLIRWVIG